MPRRVVGKAEWTGGEANPRFVVTSLTREEHQARHLYEKLYCARGLMNERNSGYLARSCAFRQASLATFDEGRSLQVKVVSLARPDRAGCLRGRR